MAGVGGCLATVVCLGCDGVGFRRGRKESWCSPSAVAFFGDGFASREDVGEVGIRFMGPAHPSPVIIPVPSRRTAEETGSGSFMLTCKQFGRFERLLASFKSWGSWTGP